MGFLH